MTERIFHIKASSKEEAERQIRRLLLSDFIKTAFLKIMNKIGIDALVDGKIPKETQEDITVICDEFEKDYQELLSRFLKAQEKK